MMSKKGISEKLAAISFFQTWFIGDFEYDGKVYNNVKQQNSNSIITPENWNDRKDVFFSQRVENYPESYPVKSVINLELEKIDKLPLLEDDYKVLADIYRDYLDTKKANLKSQSAKGTKQEKKTSYVWQGKPDEELPELYSLMTNTYSLIASETTSEQFTAIFTGQLIQSITPIRWHQDNASELLYFIFVLKNFVNIDNSKRADYQKMTACFVKPDGTAFKANWKQLRQNIYINLSKDKLKTIDELVNNFL